MTSGPIPQVSRKGFEETLTVPVNHKDSSSNTLRTFDTSFKTLNGGLMSLGKNIGLLHAKVQSVENTSKEFFEIRNKMDNLEKTQTVHTSLLTEIYELLKQATTVEEPAVATDMRVQAPIQEMEPEPTVDVRMMGVDVADAGHSTNNFNTDTVVVDMSDTPAPTAHVDPVVDTESTKKKAPKKKSARAK
jgi:hypothetical protein